MAADETLMGELHELSVRLLMERIKDGTATAADLSVARGLLKDSDITAKRGAGGALDELEDQLQRKRGKRPELTVVPSDTPIDEDAVAESLEFLLTGKM